MEILKLLPWEVWVLISGVLTGLGQAVGKKQLSTISAAQMGVLRDLVGWAVAFGAFILWGTGNPGVSIFFAIFNGAMVAVGVALYFMALRKSFSGTSVFGYLISQILIVISSALLFGEWIYFDPATRTGMGNIFVLVLTIVSMLMYVSELKLGKKWLVVLLTSAAINVAGNLIAKYFVAGQMNVWDYFAGEQTGLVVGGIVVMLVRGQRMVTNLKQVKLGIVQGMLAIMGPLIYLNILSTEPLSLASLVRRIAAIMVTTILGLTYYHERRGMGTKAWIGLGAAIVAFVVVMIVNK